MTNRRRRVWGRRPWGGPPFVGQHGRMHKEQLATVQAECQAALDDVGFEVRQVRLYPFRGEESGAAAPISGGGLLALAFKARDVLPNR